MLWNNDVESEFFKEGLKNFASPEQLFYNLKDGYYAYVPIVESDMNYFSSMVSKQNLGELISTANKESTNIAKAEKFLNLIRNL